MSKLDIWNEMAALDAKDRDFYDSLTDDEKKKFSAYLMIRWGSTVANNSEMQAYYIMNTNETLNKHYFSIPREHTKLAWLLATAISPGVGKQRHEWIGYKKKEAGEGNKSMKFLETQYPAMKQSDLELLNKINDKATIRKFQKQLGIDDKQQL
jgi:hypothetical protein